MFPLNATFVVEFAAEFWYDGVINERSSTRHQMMEMWTLPEIDMESCTRCGRCVTDCPENAVSLTEAGPAIAQPQACTYCGVCETVCPAGSISLFYTILWDDHSES
jgi:ferredoxin